MYTTLANGMQLPQIGLGTWQITDRALMAELIPKAYEAGYRLIDTAAAYSNEIAIAKAVSAAALPRDQLFLSDKVWNTSRGYDAVRAACRQSLKKLKTDYLDLYLIHWPASPAVHADWAQINADTWRGMESLYQEGLVRAIGVCNFKASQLRELAKTSAVTPMVNQLEYHPGMIQKETAAYCAEHRIALEASSPLGSGQILQNPVLLQIAASHGRSAAQICLRWALERDVIVIPKTSSPERLVQNMDVFSFTLTAEEMQSIDAIPYCGGIGIDSEEVTQFG